MDLKLSGVGDIVRDDETTNRDNDEMARPRDTDPEGNSLPLAPTDAGFWEKLCNF